jgi:hypothetical protein
MLDGDDVDFEPFEPFEPDDEIWTKIGLPEFALDPPDDVEDFVANMTAEKFLKLQKLLKTMGLE